MPVRAIAIVLSLSVAYPQGIDASVYAAYRETPARQATFGADAIVQQSWMARLPFLLWWASGRRPARTTLFETNRSDLRIRIPKSKRKLELRTLTPKEALLLRLKKRGIAIEGAAWIPESFLLSLAQRMERVHHRSLTKGLRIKISPLYLPILFSSGIAGLYSPYSKIIRLAPLPVRSAFFYFFDHEFGHHLLFERLMVMKDQATFHWKPAHSLSRGQRWILLAGWTMDAEPGWPRRFQGMAR